MNQKPLWCMIGFDTDSLHSREWILTMPSYAPAAFSIPSFAAALALAVFTALHIRFARRREGRIPISDVMWSALYIALLLVVAVFCVLGGVDGQAGILDMSAYALVLLACGVATLFRFRVTEELQKMSGPFSRALHIGFVVVATVFVSIVSAWIVDYVWLETNSSIQMQFFSLTASLFAMISVALYFLGQRGGALMVLVPLCAVGFGMAQYFVVMFKGTPIMPADLLSLRTAGAIAAGYEYVLTPNMVIALCACGVCACVHSFVGSNKGELARKVRIAASVASAVVGIALFGVMAAMFDKVKLEDRLEVAYDRWMPITTYQTLGFVPAFIEVAQDLPIPVPEGYDRGAALSQMKDLAAQFDETLGVAPGRQAAVDQFEEIKPTVIAVMNETFTDLSIYDAIREAGYEGPQFYNTLEGTLQRGPLMVSVVGGGTANTEFEFLTGNSSAFIGTGKYPYQLYDLSGVDSLVKQVESMGYRTTAMHPQNPVNWKRSTVYEQLGFNEFLSMEDFADAPVYHSGATDASTYDKVIELLEQDASPQFIFDVTMQNHSGYGEGTVPSEDVVRLDVAGIDDPAILSELGVYLACINKSDEDLAYFIDRLKGMDRPVALVFFGDHQPGFSGTLADALYGDAPMLDREFKKHESTYAVWTNYDVAGAEVGAPRTTDSSQLAAQVLYTLGAPLTDRQKAVLVLGQEVAAVSLAGYTGADGLRYALGVESPFGDSVNAMQAIQYLEFGETIGS